MVKVVANNYVKAELLEAYLKLSREIVELTNAKDKGCVRYEMCRDTKNPLHFIMLEEWESMDALNAHLESEHFRRIIPQIAPMREKEGEMAVFEKVF